jgi:hypothetical protein
MLVSKIHTYLSDKKHLKNVITKKHAKLGLTPNRQNKGLNMTCGRHIWFSAIMG